MGVGKTSGKTYSGSKDDAKWRHKSHHRGGSGTDGVAVLTFAHAINGHELSWVLGAALSQFAFATTLGATLPEVAATRCRRCSRVLSPLRHQIACHTAKISLSSRSGEARDCPKASRQCSTRVLPLSSPLKTPPPLHSLPRHSPYNPRLPLYHPPSHLQRRGFTSTDRPPHPRAPRPPAAAAARRRGTHMSRCCLCCLPRQRTNDPKPWRSCA